MSELPEETKRLVRIIADWAAPAPSTVIYVFGSRVRGDHGVDSDIDVSIEPGGPDAVWLTAQHMDVFKTIESQLGCRLIFLESYAPLRPEVINGLVVYQDRNVRCVLLPPKPTSE
jgi:predicted nucleotidyltransferase